MTRTRHKLIWYTKVNGKENCEAIREKYKHTLDRNYLIAEARELAAYHTDGNAHTEECRHDAFAILTLIGDVEAGLRTGDINQTLVAAYWLGRYVERLGKFRPLEFAAGVGLDQLDRDKEVKAKMDAEREELGQIFSSDTKRDALALFHEEMKKGKLVKAANASVEREYGVKPRTLRTWRNEEKDPKK